VTEVEIIKALDQMALEIMHDKTQVEKGESVLRSEQLERVFKYQICCAILNGEISFENLTRLIP
jgi:hypothetical protein